MPNLLLILLGKLISFFSSTFGLGNGSTWPGHIALSLNRNFIKDISSKNNIRVIFIAGTNGKTTTASMIEHILLRTHNSVMRNSSGANLLNGIASVFVSHSSLFGKLDSNFAVFEIDENMLPLVLKQITPDAIILLNLFRDQLDRYGELDSIAKKWNQAFDALNNRSLLILNADDPLLAYLGKKTRANVTYFGLQEKNNNKTLQHASDSIYCPKCNHKLEYKTLYYSHLGHWYCTNCRLTRSKPDLSSSLYPLPGTYNKYNTLAAVLYAKHLGFPDERIFYTLESFSPAFGRQEELILDNKLIKIFLSKNPASFNQSLMTVRDLGAKNILLVLNDRIPDGRDISWIWDIDFEEYISDFTNIFVSGDRAYDMGLRLQYTSEYQISNIKYQIFENLKVAIRAGLKSIDSKQTLYVLPTYSAMLEVRKILTGKKIL